MNKTLLAIDIGNTTITCGLFRGRRLTRRLVRPTRAGALFRLPALSFDAVIIASVVPSAEKAVLKYFSHTGVRPLVVGSGVRVPVKNRYQKPRQVGADRLVNAYAAIRLYGAPAVIVDFGTAVTFDAVSPKAEYIGGMIFPGLRMSLEALHEKTALLPEIPVRKPTMLIGRTTKDSITSGLVFGYAALTRSLVALIKKETGKNTRVIATGGNARFLAAYCGVFDTVDPDLTLQGLRLIHDYYEQKKPR